MRKIERLSVTATDSIVSNASYIGRSPLSMSRYKYRTSLTG